MALRQFKLDNFKIFAFAFRSLNVNTRLLSTSPVAFLREVQRTETENQIIIEGKKVESERKGNIVDTGSRGGCPLCKVGLKNLQHTDILILSQFLNSDGTVIPQHISGLCKKQQGKVTRAIILAQRAGLIPKKPGTPVFGDWEKYNTYFKRF